MHLRKRSLHEQTEKASRILAEEMEGRAEEAGDDEHGYVSAARGPLLVGSNGRTAESDEQVKLSDILELALELLELVETHVGRCGTLEDVARFENQLKVRGEEHAICTRGSTSLFVSNTLMGSSCAPPTTRVRRFSCASERQLTPS